MAYCRGSAEEYTACARQPVCARSQHRCYLSHATTAGEGGHRVRHGETRPGRHARLEYVLRGRCPAALSLLGHGRKAQGRRSRATRSCDGWRQAAPPAPALGLAMRGCRPREAAARQDRSVRRRGTVQAEATRLYSAGLGASQRALTGASVSGIPEGRLYQEKAPSQNTSEGDDQEQKLSIGMHGGKNAGSTVVRLPWKDDGRQKADVRRR